ncbi:MAG: Oligosaccharyl transferase STT3 subunit [Candidatus Magasanikbacteria bacterium GW2011_GWC2_40_17]|uniref:Oligosaccharyl transferase STT3 subunit n=1 Tax=Candidatus Magasanikbacteria bacterium GW2011_GWA2_42_32 TaxID=1619039 RepID=A0A0G1CFP1_9BACT|nr:MAG: Oligosaccharyl transferase STT3 subunit [Candidatus Magasanikbacteria bacterium GW2011_GWC2_40_17]KKS57391.1 MAG: Oligosaccharyl transferase STT3 subunit [Candidatus Magasanikbacteria bacterium GW2011_GWA2_42_32]
MFLLIKKIIANRYILLGLVLFIAIVSFYFFIIKHPLNNPVFSDQGQYDDLAINLLEGRGFSTTWELRNWIAFRPPIYPVFLSIIYSFFGHNYLSVKIIQFLLSIFSVLLVYLIAEKIFNKAVGFFSALFISIYPIYLSFNLYLIRESLFIFLLLVFSYFLINAISDPSWRNFILSGIFFGFLVLTRSTVIFALPMYLIWFLFFFYKEKKMILKVCFGFGLVAVFIISIWLVRGQILSGAPNFEYTGSEHAWVFATGRSENLYKDLTGTFRDILLNNSDKSEGSLVKKLSQETLSGILSNPVPFFKTGLHNLFIMHCLSGTCTTLWEPFFVILGFIGLFVGLIFLPRITIFFLIPIVSINFMSAFFGGNDSRFRAPADWIYAMYIVGAFFLFFQSVFGKNGLKEFVLNKLFFGERREIISKRFKIIISFLVIIPTFLVLIGVSRIVKANIFCDNIYLNNISQQKAEEVLNSENFLFKKNKNNWAPFAEIKKYLFENNFNLGKYDKSLISWTGTIRNPIYGEAGKSLDVVITNNFDPFKFTAFNFVINSSSCGSNDGNLYGFFPGILSQDFKDKNFIVVGQLKESDSSLDHLNINVIYLIPLDRKGQPKMDQILLANDAVDLNKSKEFYEF